MGGERVIGTKPDGQIVDLLNGIKVSLVVVYLLSEGIKLQNGLREGRCCDDNYRDQASEEHLEIINR
jgi:hypothetical protein